MADQIRVGDIVRIDNSMHRERNGELAVVIAMYENNNVIKYEVRIDDEKIVGGINASKVTLIMRPIPSEVMEDTRAYLEIVTTQENVL